MQVRLRSFLSALCVAALTMPLLVAGCPRCVASPGVSSPPPSCCDPAGHCQASRHQVAPATCFTTQTTDAAVIEQPLHFEPVTAFVEMLEPFVVHTQELTVPAEHDRSPAPIHLLNSALLI